MLNSFLKKHWVELFIVLIILAGISFLAYQFFVTGPALEAEGKAWVDQVVPKIVSSWDKEEFKKNSSPKLLKILSDDTLEKTFKMFSGLGGLKKYNGSEGGVRIDINNGIKTVSASYLAKVQLEKIQIAVSIRGEKENGVWKIVSFYVNPIDGGSVDSTSTP